MVDKNTPIANITPLSIPREWVERRLAASDPSLKKDAIGGLRTKLDDLRDEPTCLGVPSRLKRYQEAAFSQTSH